MLELKGILSVIDQLWHFVANKKDQREKMSTTQFESFVRHRVKILTHVFCFKPSVHFSPLHVNLHKIYQEWASFKIAILQTKYPKDREYVESTATRRNVIQSL